MKLLVAALLALFVAEAADDVNPMHGTWKFHPGKSDWTHKPGGAPRDATMTISDDRWVYRFTDAAAKTIKLHFSKQTNSISGLDKLRVHNESTGNPNVSDMRVSDADTGAEIERVVTVAVPGDDVLLFYGSGIAADGKLWWDFSYYKGAR